ncbi:haloacid dehalogenase, type II [Rhodococcus sp. WMMA185]|nr:haloacid dehalogenase, type II [Rhodococcus sp. WMMA185]
MVRPEVVVFDVVETLASLDPVRARLNQLQQPNGLLERWFTRLLRDAMAMTSAGDYRSFPEVAASALRAETHGALSDSQIELAVGGFGELTAQPEATETLEAAKEAGFRIFALSNGSEESTRGFFERSGLAPKIDEVLSVEAVKAWKPAPAPYQLAVDRAQVPAERMAMVAVHSWDIHGAHRAGLTTGWCPRLETVSTPIFTSADVTADSLPEVIHALARLTN